MVAIGGGFSAEDWITIWQSEMAARAVDREAHEFVVSYAENWLKLAHDAASGNDRSAGRSGADAAAWSAALGAAPDAVRDGLEQLRRQFEALHRSPGGA